MNQKIEKIIDLIKYSGEDIESLSNKGYDFLDIFSALNWVVFTDNQDSEGLRILTDEEKNNIPDNLRNKFYKYFYSDNINYSIKENFLDILGGFSDIKADVDEKEIENLMEVVFNEKAV